VILERELQRRGRYNQAKKEVKQPMEVDTTPEEGRLGREQGTEKGKEETGKG